MTTDKIYKECREIMFDLFASYDDYDHIKNALRNLNSENEITDTQYDICMEKWEDFLYEFENQTTEPHKIYVIMFQGVIDDITDYWGEALQSEHGFFTDRKEAEKFRDELNAKNGFEYDISDDCEQQYFYICEIEAHGK